MNTRLISKCIYITFSLLLISTLYSCSSGNGSGAGNSTSATAGRAGSNTSKLTVSITDAPIDSAREVWVQFTGLSIKPVGGDAIDFTFESEKNINLLALEGVHSINLLSNTEITAGKYSWIRLDVNAINDNINDTYIVLNDGSTHELWIPSGEQTGLKINTPFEVIENEALNLMLDFDLRKSIVLQGNSYKLRPTLRMVNKNNTDNITGTIDLSLLTSVNCSDTDPVTGNAVYLFTGTNTVPSDISNGNSNLETSARIKLNQQTGDYEYIIGYVPVGDYTLAFTCQADLDDPSRKDNIMFSFTTNLTVTANAANAELLITPPNIVR